MCIKLYIVLIIYVYEYMYISVYLKFNRVKMIRRLFVTYHVPSIKFIDNGCVDYRL